MIGKNVMTSSLIYIENQTGKNEKTTFSDLRNPSDGITNIIGSQKKSNRDSDELPNKKNVRNKILHKNQRSFSENVFCTRFL